jgi:hypothetical protein
MTALREGRLSLAVEPTTSGYRLLLTATTAGETIVLDCQDHPTEEAAWMAVRDFAAARICDLGEASCG